VSAEPAKARRGRQISRARVSCEDAKEMLRKVIRKGMKAQ